MLKSLFCKHEYKPLTNIHGDLRLSFNCCSIYKCSKCNKWKKSFELIPDFNVVNFEYKHVKERNNAKSN